MVCMYASPSNVLLMLSETGILIEGGYCELKLKLGINYTVAKPIFVTHESVGWFFRVLCHEVIMGRHYPYSFILGNLYRI